MLKDLRHSFWRHERRLTLAYIAAVALGLLALAVAPVRAAILDKAEAAAMRWDARWVGRVERGEALVREGKHRDAVAYLEALDRDFPAQYAKHRLDDERKRVLRALGASHQALGDSAGALGAYRRLVRFDPRDYLSHVQLADAAAKFGGTQEAVAQWREALAINPGHLPSLRALIGALAAEARGKEIVTAFDAYVDALVIQHVVVALGDTSATVDVPVDGAPHAAEVALARPAGWAGPMSVDAGGFAAQVTDVTIRAPMLVGAPGAEPVRLALGDSAGLRAQVPAQPAGVARVALTVRLTKPVDAALWAAAEKAYLETGAEVRARIVRPKLDVTPSAADADKVVVDVTL